jgi:hypothetical protein
MSEVEVDGGLPIARGAVVPRESSGASAKFQDEADEVEADEADGGLPIASSEVFPREPSGKSAEVEADEVEAGEAEADEAEADDEDADRGLPLASRKAFATKTPRGRESRRRRPPRKKCQNRIRMGLPTETKRRAARGPTTFEHGAWIIGAGRIQCGCSAAGQLAKETWAIGESRFMR